MNILVIGGYGNFGRRLVASLCRYHQHSLIIAGRSLAKAQQLQQQLYRQTGKVVGAIRLDIERDDLVKLFTDLQPQIVINASGPYQLQMRSADRENNYRVAKACLEIPCHYIDLADDRAFVNYFPRVLAAQATQRNVMLVTGASTVPGLTAAVIDAFIDQFSQLEVIEYGIAPGNRTERGRATVGSILSYTGKPFLTLNDGHFKTVYGWQGTRRHDFGEPLGKRWLGNCDIPDLECLQHRYPSLKTIHFQAGLEVSLLHLGLWSLSWLPQLKLIHNLASYTNLLTNISGWFLNWGSDSGGMFIKLAGTDQGGKNKTLHWQLIAENGTGPNVPTIAAELLVNRITVGNVVPGARICMGLFNLNDFFAVAKRWGIYQRQLNSR